jgi:hypothetical protein
MAEEPDDNSTYYDENEETDSETSDSGTNDTETSEDSIEEFSLRGLRFFANRLEGEENDEDDVQAEELDIEYSYPSTEFITDRLVLHHYVTMEHLVATLIQSRWTGPLPEEYQSSLDVPRLIQNEIGNFLNTLPISVPLPFAEPIILVPNDGSGAIVDHVVLPRRTISERVAPVNPIAIPAVAEEKIPIRILYEFLD